MTVEQLAPFVKRRNQNAQHILEDILFGMRHSRRFKETTLSVLQEICQKQSKINLKSNTLLGKLRKFDYIEVDGETVRIKKTKI